MTMLALAFSHDFCVVAADRAVGNLNINSLNPTTDEATKLKFFNSTTMPFVATAAGFAEAVELVPNFVKNNPIESPTALTELAQNLAASMKSALDENTWSRTHTTSCLLALTTDNKFFVHALYLNEETVLFSGYEPTKSVIPAGFCDPNHQAHKERWQQALTEAIMPCNTHNRTPLERLNQVLQILSAAFQECASLNEFVSSNFDFCVITKPSRTISFNCIPNCALFAQNNAN
ncbi:hypothetical protein HJ160_24050 [Vibrio parahaemolyticus]|nr:hypothetical protein [Vibrio parahaemolyticus]